VTYPFPYPETLAAVANATGSEGVARLSRCVHPIHLAMKWRRMLDADASLNMAQLARNQGVSRARVTQVMNLKRAFGQDAQDDRSEDQQVATERAFTDG
jgi:hypothetical protein